MLLKVFDSTNESLFEDYIFSYSYSPFSAFLTNATCKWQFNHVFKAICTITLGTDIPTFKIDSLRKTI